MQMPRIVGGQFLFVDLSTSLSDKDFAIAKVHIWLHMLNDGHKPVKWYKTYKNGTKVNFETIHTQAEYDQGLQDLATFVEVTNKEYDLDMNVIKDG